MDLCVRACVRMHTYMRMYTLVRESYDLNRMDLS
jgi:hypothetical protein